MQLHAGKGFRDEGSNYIDKVIQYAATMVPLVVTTFSKLGPSAEGCLQGLVYVACSARVVDRGSWLRIAHQYLICALVCGRDFVFRYYCQSMAASKCWERLS